MKVKYVWTANVFFGGHLSFYQLSDNGIFEYYCEYTNNAWLVTSFPTEYLKQLLSFRT